MIKLVVHEVTTGIQRFNPEREGFVVVVVFFFFFFFALKCGVRCFCFQIAGKQNVEGFVFTFTYFVDFGHVTQPFRNAVYFRIVL